MMNTQAPTHDFVRSLRRTWWVVAAGAVVGLLIGLAVAATATPLYESTSLVSVYIAPASDERDDVDVANDDTRSEAQRLARELLSSPEVADQVREMGGRILVLGYRPAEGVGRADVRITIQAPTSDGAAELANDLAAQTADAADLTVVERAEVDFEAVEAQAPGFPDTPVLLWIGAMTGLLVGLGVSLILFLRTRRAA